MHQYDHTSGELREQSPDSKKDNALFGNYNGLSFIVHYFYVFLFAYTGYSKLNDIEAFTKGVRRIPFFGHFPELIAWGIPTLELLLAICMILPIRKLQRLSFRASVSLMAVFTLYLLGMVTLVKEKLCHCGGVIESMGWTQHLVFNFIVLLLGIWAIRKIN